VAVVNRAGPGGALALAAAAEGLHRAHPGKFVTAAEGEACELFHHHPDVVAAEPEADGRPVRWQRVEFAPPAACGRGARPGLLARACACVLARELGLPGPFPAGRPRVHLSPGELALPPEVHAAAGSRRYALIEGAGGQASDWAARALRGGLLPVLIGPAAPGCPPPPGSLDLRGVADLRRVALLAFHAAGGLGEPGVARQLCEALGRPFVCPADPPGRRRRAAAGLLAPGA
jgi:hypothetical protein